MSLQPSIHTVILTISLISITKGAIIKPQNVWLCDYCSMGRCVQCVYSQKVLPSSAQTGWSSVVNVSQERSKVILSQPKFNQQLSSTEFEV